jgi:putative transcriptional regulator
MKNRVQLFRKAKHWTQSDLGARVGVNRDCIDAIEKGRFLPSIALAYNIAAAVAPVAAIVRALAIRSVPQPRVSSHPNREA